MFGLDALLLKVPYFKQGCCSPTWYYSFVQCGIYFSMSISTRDIVFRFKFCFSSPFLLHLVMLVIFAPLSLRIFPYMVFSISSSFPADVFRFGFDQVSSSNPPMLLFLVLLLPLSLPFYFIILLTLFHFDYDFLLTVVVPNCSLVIVCLA